MAGICGAAVSRCVGVYERCIWRCYIGRCHRIGEGRVCCACVDRLAVGWILLTLSVANTVNNAALSGRAEGSQAGVIVALAPDADLTSRALWAWSSALTSKTALFLSALHAMTKISFAEAIQTNLAEGTACEGAASFTVALSAEPQAAVIAGRTGDANAWV